MRSESEIKSFFWLCLLYCSRVNTLPALQVSPLNDIEEGAGWNDVLKPLLTRKGKNDDAQELSV
jgi:hypothetical protein